MRITLHLSHTFSRLKGEEDSSALQSKSSSRLGFEVKSTRGRKKRDSSMEDEPGSHRVTFTVTIAQAVPTGILIALYRSMSHKE